MSELFAKKRPTIKPTRRTWAYVGALVAVLLIVAAVTGWYWSREPASDYAELEPRPQPYVVGYATVDTIIRTCGWLLEKPGGYLSNDIFPLSSWLDNMPSFEFGVLEQCRDIARVLRDRYSRSQSQSTEDPDLAIAQPALNYSNDSWIFPTTESKIREALTALRRYRARISDPNDRDAQFFARADNLSEWLALVELRLGSLSQRLSASVGQIRINTDFAGDPSAESSTTRSPEIEVHTPWLEIDNVFFEARGAAWSLLQFMQAIERDFGGVLADKNATVSIRQITRELSEALGPISSPIILNGKGYGFFANHSLVLASYLSRAHSAIIDVRSLLQQG